MRRVVLVLVLTSAAACGGKPFDSALPPIPTTTTAEITVPPTSTPVTSSHITSGALRTRVIPTPPGYQVSKLPGTHNGPISRAAFNQQAGMKDAADTLGFIEGYDLSFDRDDYSDGFEITVLRLSSDVDASAFAATVGEGIDPAEVPKVHPYPDIAGALEADGTKPTSDGSWDYVVSASRGAWLMIVQYNNQNGGPFPTTMRSVVTSEYALI
jgi:hypothetical protein